MSDRFLAGVATGRVGAIDDCIRRYSAPVWSLARRMSPSIEDAEDAVQDVFLSLWKNAGRFDPAAGSEMTFVMTVARRRLIDRLRRHGRAPATESIESPEVLPAEATPDQVQITDEVEKVNSAMEQLRPAQRDVLQLSLVQGFSHQQIAERTGLPLGTVKSHARRGLMRVRDLLGVPRDPSASGGKS